ncbi:MAG: hypothetical protein IH627_05075 [Rubrivivax sp.]|nr:hypothetical protein [Rubrivivax sp.]
MLNIVANQVSSSVDWLGLLLLVWLAVVAAIVVWYRRDIVRLWREPVLKLPVLVLESDDWGAGPLSQASALDDMAAVLRRFRDSTGRPPVMSLAVVLAVPDGSAIAVGGGTYRRVCLDEAPLTRVLDALKRGEAEGVFSLQLHGLEHYWPDTLMASDDQRVLAWLREASPASTESLQARFQYRWIDTRCLPSSPHPSAAVEEAVREEVEAFRRAFGRTPAVVVPPAFAWTPVVERAWSSSGIECVVTPGERYVRCAADGELVDDGERFANGDRSNGILYLVRNDYFEPARGRDAEYALRAMRRASSAGRPCVLENHRVNFCSEPAMRAHSLQELEKLVACALSLMPKLRFLSSSDLFHILKVGDPHWIMPRWRDRFPYFWQRLSHSGRPWKLLRLTGVALLGGFLLRVAPIQSTELKSHPL